MRKRFEETQRFKALEAGGRVIYIVELTTFGLLGDQLAAEWVPVNRRYRTTAGEPVQLRNDGTYVVVSTGAKLARA